jgi:hypothetical protein
MTVNYCKNFTFPCTFTDRPRRACFVYLLKEKALNLGLYDIFISVKKKKIWKRKREREYNVRAKRN